MRSNVSYYHWNISKRISRRSTFHTAASRILFVTLQLRRIQNPFKHLRWSAFAYPVNDFKQLTVYAKHSLLYLSRGSECACVQIAPGNVLCHLSTSDGIYFEFLNCSMIICLPLNIWEKLRWQHFIKKLEEAENHRLYFF